jgi:hypothetical protein
VGGLTGRLRDAIRGLARSESLKQLEKRGVRRVSVLGLDRIVALIEEAVERSLRDRLLRFERTEVAETTKEQFLELLQRHQTLAEDRAALLEEKRAAEETVHELREELERRRRELEAREAEAEAVDAARRADQDGRLLEAFDELVRSIEPEEARARSLVEKLGPFVVKTVQEQRRLEAENAPSETDELDNLRRRVRKLTESLTDSEQRLQQAIRQHAPEEGIASIYRTVQGLSDAEPEFERKKTLMADIFEANLSLQKRRSEARRDTGS